MLLWLQGTAGYVCKGSVYSTLMNPSLAAGHNLRDKVVKILWASLAPPLGATYAAQARVRVLGYRPRGQRIAFASGLRTLLDLTP